MIHLLSAILNHLLAFLDVYAKGVEISHPRKVNAQISYVVVSVSRRFRGGGNKDLAITLILWVFARRARHGRGHAWLTPFTRIVSGDLVLPFFGRLRAFSGFYRESSSLVFFGHGPSCPGLRIFRTPFTQWTLWRHSRSRALSRCLLRRVSSL